MLIWPLLQYRIKYRMTWWNLLWNFQKIVNIPFKTYRVFDKTFFFVSLYLSCACRCVLNCLIDNILLGLFVDKHLLHFPRDLFAKDPNGNHCQRKLWNDIYVSTKFACFQQSQKSKNVNMPIVWWRQHFRSYLQIIRKNIWIHMVE